MGIRRLRRAAGGGNVSAPTNNKPTSSRPERHGVVIARGDTDAESESDSWALQYGETILMAVTAAAAIINPPLRVPSMARIGGVGNNVPLGKIARAGPDGARAAKTATEGTRPDHGFGSFRHLGQQQP